MVHGFAKSFLKIVICALWKERKNERRLGYESVGIPNLSETVFANVTREVNSDKLRTSRMTTQNGAILEHNTNKFLTLA